MNLKPVIKITTFNKFDYSDAKENVYHVSVDYVAIDNSSILNIHNI